jgi:hypothetical protein
MHKTIPDAIVLKGLMFLAAFAAQQPPHAGTCLLTPTVHSNCEATNRTAMYCCMLLLPCSILPGSLPGVCGVQHSRQPQQTPASSSSS